MLTIEDTCKWFKENLLLCNSIEEAFTKTLREVYQQGLEDRVEENGKEVWINKKKGTRYTLLGKGPDCTNVRDGTIVAIYCPEGCPDLLYVREWDEWVVKFYKDDENNKESV